MRVADYIVDFLVNHEIEHCFMLSGGGAIYLDDALACNENITCTGVRNEATAPMMAEAYARIKGNMGAVFVTTGPGGTNAVTGVAEAWVDSTPIIVISGQVERECSSRLANAQGIRSYGTQEIDIVEIVKSITKYAEIVNEPNDIRYHLEKAIFMAKEGRPGPVWLDIPLDVQSAEINTDELRSYEVNYVKPCASEEDLQNVINQLNVSRNPLCIVGQGVRLSEAVEEFKAFIENNQIPVISSRLGQDILNYNHPCYCGHGGNQGTAATAEIMKQADYIIVLGSSIAPSFIGNRKAFNDNAYICAIDIDESQLKKNESILSYAILGDLKDFLGRLNLKRGEIKNTNNYNWLKECKKTTQEKAIIYNVKETCPINIYYFVRKLDELADENSIFVDDAGSSYYSTGQSLSFNTGAREITSGTFASMGLTLPLAIGAACANRNATVLAITGDGSIETNIQELRTLAVEGQNVKLFIINNGGYLSIRNTQDNKFDGRRINSEQGKENSILDFKEVSKCFEIPYYYIQENKDIERVYREVVSFDGPAIIEVLTDKNQKIYTCY